MPITDVGASPCKPMWASLGTFLQDMAAILGALAPCKITDVGIFGFGGGSEAPCKSLLASLDVFWRGLTTLLGAPPCNPMYAPLGRLLARSGGISGASRPGALLDENCRRSWASPFYLAALLGGGGIFEAPRLCKSI